MDQRQQCCRTSAVAGSWLSLHDVSSGACTKQVASVEEAKGLLSPYAFALAVLFLGATAIFSRCFSSCAFKNVGAFSHGLDRCTIAFRLTVVSFADNAWCRGILYLARYDRPSKPCPLRWRTESCLRDCPHSRHVTVCFVILFFQWIGAGGVCGVRTATLL